MAKYARPMSRPHGHWSAHLSCTDPVVGPLNRARLEGILDAYPDLEGVFLSIPEGFFQDPYPETDALIQREWDKYGEALELLRKYWGKFWPGTDRQNEHMRADIAFTENVKKTIAEAKNLKPDLKLGICTVCKSYLLTHLHDVLPKDMPFIDIESRALWTLEGAPLHLFQRMKGRECVVILRAVDDGSLAGMQFSLWQYSRDRFLESAEENGTAGLMIQTTHIRGNEHSMRYLASGMWGGCREPVEFYREYAMRVFGEQAADRIVDAFMILEKNDEHLGGRGQKNLPWNMLPQHIGIMKSFRDFERPFDRAPFAVETVQAFERSAEMFKVSIGYLSQALALLEGTGPDTHESGRRELAYIVSRTKGYRAHLQALVDITGLYRTYYEIFEEGPRNDLPGFRRTLGALVEDAARLEARTRTSARFFAACVSHTTDLAVLWMISHKMVLGSQCLHGFLSNIQAFYDGREYWKPVPWDKLFGRSVYPAYTLEPLNENHVETEYEPG
ncbi:MAG: hypothetical protein K9N51_03765 [Candidatus Pacebacteria bacterium]|nr:hypothetical protein [Candidatus Paceibacterota bacterium]